MVDLLYKAVARERSRLFVGRKSELESVSQRLSDPNTPTAVISVTGMGGVGKSTLLLRIQELARAHGALPIWVDGGACGRTPLGFLSYLDTVIDSQAQSAEASGGAARFVPRRDQRTVWCIDNFEELEPIDGWLRERFFAAFPSTGQLIVVASRQQLSERWRDDPGWKVRLHHCPLEPLSRSESKEYLGRVGVADTAIEDLIRRTGGLPLALSLAADAFFRRPDAIDHEESDLTLAVTVRLLRETAGTSLQPLLDVLAVVPEADAALIAHVAGERLGPERLDSLARLSFVQSSRRGFRLHDVARQYLLAELQKQDMEHYRRIRKLAAFALLKRLDSAPPQEAAAYARTLLTVCSDALPSAENYAILSSLPLSLMRSARLEDLPELHRLVDEWGSQPFVFHQPESYHQLLDCIVQEFPEMCRVARSEEGECLGMLATVLLWRDTAERIEAIEPGALARHLPVEHERILALPAEEADTYFAVMVGAARQSEAFSLEEIIGGLIRDGLARLGEGTRALLGAGQPALVQLLESLGFQMYQDGARVLSHLGLRWILYELDLRSGRFGPWALSFIDDARGREPHGLVRANALALADLRTLLANFNDPDVWERSRAATAIGVNPDQLRTQLKNVLVDGAPLAPPFTEEDRKLLFETFFLRRPPLAVADDLHVSRATYYRHLRRALDRLREALIHVTG